jgi:hypothetical protein
LPTEIDVALIFDPAFWASKPMYRCGDVELAGVEGERDHQDTRSTK